MTPDLSPLLPRAQLHTVYKYIELKGNLQDLVPQLTPLTKHKTAVTQLAKQGLKDLEEVTVHLCRLGVKLQVSERAFKTSVSFLIFLLSD